MRLARKPLYRIANYVLICIAISLSSNSHASTLVKNKLKDFLYTSDFETNKQSQQISYLTLEQPIRLRMDSAPLWPTTANLTAEQEANYLRAGLEVSIILGVGLIGYNYWQEKMKDDWEFDYSSLNDYLQRLFTTDHIKFDDNDILYNWGHVYAGAFYHQAGRVNGFSYYESVLISIAASSVWEYAIEFREAISINDQIMTGIGGPILGETFHQMAKLLKRRSKTPFSKALATYFQPVDVIEKVFDKRGIAKNSIEPKPVNISRFNDEELDLFFGTKSVKQDGNDVFTLVEFGVKGEIVDLPTKSEGQVNKLVIDTAAVELIQEFSFSDHGLRDYYSFTKVVPSAYFSKNISKHQTGYTMFIGPAGATEYNSRGFGHEQDFYAIVNVLGATLDTTVYKRKKSLRMAFDVYGDFAFVRPYATNQYFDAGESYAGAKTVLQKKNYYYAIGTSVRSRIEAQPTNKLKIGLLGVQHKLKSFDEGSKDRHAEDVTRSLVLKDRLASLKFWVSYKANHRWKIGAAVERIFRSGSIEEIESETLKSLYVSDIETTYKLHFNYNIL